MRELVIDASVAVKWLVQEEHSNEARLLLQHLSLAQGSANLILIAPDVILAEIGHALRRLVNRGEIAPALSEILYDYFVTHVPLVLIGLHSDPRYDAENHLVQDAIRLGNQNVYSFYDALYICLALKRNAFLVTSDRKLYEKPLPLSQGQQLIWVGDIPQWLSSL
ncbi:MAG: type II toxin-antitoxin system VapC family toxin [Armatimonadota bacterium]